MITLTERLPDRIKVHGKTYRLKPDFRNVLNMMEMLGRTDIIQEARTYQALRCVMRHPPKDDRLCAEVMQEFRKVFSLEGVSGKTEKRLTSFKQDADLIRGAFRQAYHIDLFREKLHWLEFSCLLACLPEGSRYTEIIGIRARPIPKLTKYNKEEREAIIKAKQAHKLDLDENEIALNFNNSINGIAQFMISKARRGGDIDK